MTDERSELAALAGRATSDRADTRRTRERLIDAVQLFVGQSGSPPERLADVAELAGVSTATAYRHFASVDDAIQAVVLELPVRAAELFAISGGYTDRATDDLQRWNRSWVDACIEHGELAVHLRSPVGFLQRRTEGDPIIAYACEQIEPILAAAGGDVTMMLFTWNLISDPREVIDLQRLGWDAQKIADFVTRSVLATPPV